MKLSGKDPFENSLSGGSAKITELPINMQLSYTVKKSDGLIMSASNDPSMYADRDPAINSLLNLAGNMQPFTFHEDDDSNTEDRELVQETISNAAGGDGNVIVGAAFQTASTSSVGEGTISFESATGAIGADAATFGPTIVRYEATGAMIGSSYKGTSRTTTTAVRELCLIQFFKKLNVNKKFIFLGSLSFLLISLKFSNPIFIQKISNINYDFYQKVFKR